MPLKPKQIGDWFVDPSRDVIRSGTTEIKLEPRAMRLLCCLADPPGEVHTTDELLGKVRPGLVVGQNSLYQAIAQLRRALGDLDDQARYIETVPRKGYRLIAPVTSPPRDAAVAWLAASSAYCRAPSSLRASSRSRAWVADTDICCASCCSSRASSAL